MIRDQLKEDALRLTVLSNLITTTPGWKKFQHITAHHSLYSTLTRRSRCVVNQHFPGLGYLLLLEKALGATEFRELCPLILPVNDRLISRLLSANGRLTKDSLPIHYKSALCQLLFTFYSTQQRAHAHRLWPTHIGAAIDQALKQALPPVMTKQVPWPFCQAFLQVRYGLPNVKPITRINQLPQAVIDKAALNTQLGSNARSFDKSKIFLSCANEVTRALQHPFVKPHLCNFAHTFSSSRASAKAWRSIIAAARQQFKNWQSSRETLSLQTPISVLLNVRASNVLDRAGIRNFSDLCEVPRSTLLSIPQIGETTIQDLQAALRKVISAVQTRQRLV